MLYKSKHTHLAIKPVAPVAVGTDAADFSGGMVPLTSSGL
jgi:hypothetical protein